MTPTHGANTGQGQADDRSHSAARLGLRLFAVYCLAYAAFVGTCTFRPAWLEAELPGGLNLAVVAGLGLIATAFVMALIYAWACRGSGPAGPGAAP